MGLMRPQRLCYRIMIMSLGKKAAAPDPQYRKLLKTAGSLIKSTLTRPPCNNDLIYLCKLGAGCEERKTKLIDRKEHDSERTGY